MEFGLRLTEALNGSKYTQNEIAKALGISRSNISNWKNGTNYPSVEMLIKLCKLLDISADYLLGLD